jgi:hypothetical protein
VGFTHTLDTLEALRRAESLARLIGGQEYLDARYTELTQSLLDAERLPERIVRGDRRYDIRRVPVAGYTVRRLPAKARQTLERAHPAAWEAAVRVSPPERSHHIRLDAGRPGLQSTEWRAHKDAGAARWSADLEQRFGARDWSRATVRATTALELRQLRGEHGKTVDKAKIELAEFVVARELPLIIPGYRDGKIVARRNPDTYVVDYDLLEQRFPEAARLITRSTVPERMRLDFVEWKPTPEDPDDSDDSAMGSDYRARMAGRPGIW